MGEEITVSVIVPVFNMERYVRKCIESVLAQTYRDFELILTNDGSADSSERIIDEFIEREKDRIWKINKPNGGLSSSLNIALDRARGKYAAFLDADDSIDAHYLETLTRKAESENLDVVCSGMYRINEKGDKLETVRYTFHKGRCLHRRLSNHGKLYRMDYIRKWSLSFPEGKLYEDNSFNLQALFLTSKVGFLEYVGYFQLRYKGSLTSSLVDPGKLPYAEWMGTAKRVRKEHVEGADLELFDFTFMSFLTYFLLLYLPQRSCLTEKNKDLFLERAEQIAHTFEEIVNALFPAYRKNKYARLGMFRELPMAQRMGTKVFYWFCRIHKLCLLVRWFYWIRNLIPKTYVIE